MAAITILHMAFPVMIPSRCPSPIHATTSGALVTVAGNPVVSTPQSERLDQALEGLDFMVSLDIYVNETTRHADVILPGPSSLARWSTRFQTTPGAGGPSSTGVTVPPMPPR